MAHFSKSLHLSSARLVSHSLLKRHKAHTTPKSPSLAPLNNQRPTVVVHAQARRPRDGDEWVSFDGEDQWYDDEVRLVFIFPSLPSFHVNTLFTRPLSQPSTSSLSGPILQQSMRAVSMVVDKLADMALQVAPADASPSAIRAAVTGGLILLTLSFVKGILSVRFFIFVGIGIVGIHLSIYMQFFITIGMVLFGAFVAVRIFGLDINGATMYDDTSSSSSTRKDARKNKKKGTSTRSNSDSDQVLNPVAGLLSGVLESVTGGSDGESGDNGLVDVWFPSAGTGKNKKQSNNGKVTKRRR